MRFTLLTSYRKAAIFNANIGHSLLPRLAVIWQRPGVGRPTRVPFGGNLKARIFFFTTRETFFFHSIFNKHLTTIAQFDTAN
jgi:hypothetical protein